MMKYANDNNFDEVRNLDKLTLVDFFATWCMPCQMQSEVLEKIDTSRANDLEIVKINVDESPEISNEFEIESIPTLVLMKNGKVLKRVVGYRGEQEILEIINEIK